MTDPIQRLRSTSPGDDHDFDQQGGHARLHALMAAERPGRTTRCRRTTLGGLATGGVACAGLTFVLVLGTGGTEPAPTPAVAATQQTAPSTSGGVEVRTASWYASASVDAIDATDLTGLVLRVDRVMEGDDPLPSSTSIDAGDGTATLYRDGDSGVVETRRLIDDEGTMQYTWVNDAAGIYTTFPWTTEEYVDEAEGIAPLQEQIRQNVVTQMDELREQMTVMEVREEAGSGWTVLAREDTTLDGVPVVRVDYRDDEPSDEELAAGMAATTAFTESIYYDTSTNLPVRVETVYTLLIDGQELDSHDTVTYQWLPATEENRALMTPQTEGLREVDQSTFDALTY